MKRTRTLRFPIAAKLLSAFAVLLCITAFVGLQGRTGLAHMQTAFADLNRRTELAQGSKDIQMLVYRQSARVGGYILTQNPDESTDAFAASEELGRLLDHLIETATIETTRTEVQANQGGSGGLSEGDPVDLRGSAGRT